jgi:hypothetical protein
MVGSGVPTARQLRVAGEPRGTERSTGLSTISGKEAATRRKYDKSIN